MVAVKMPASRSESCTGPVGKGVQCVAEHGSRNRHSVCKGGLGIRLRIRLQVAFPCCILVHGEPPSVLSRGSQARWTRHLTMDHTVTSGYRGYTVSSLTRDRQRKRRPTMPRRGPSLLDVTSDSNDSQDDAHEVSKKRKPTYYVRKEEKASLEREILELQEKIRLLEAAQEVNVKSALDQSIALNATLTSDIEINNLALAGAQSMISAEMVSRFRNPLDHYIYLPEDASLRRQTLLALHAAKSEAGIRLLRERTRYLDIRQAHRHSETTVLKNGDYVVTFFEVLPFEGLHDVRHVYNQFLEYVATQEIRLSEQLGVITIRESDDCDESAVSHCRLLSSITPDVDMESNLAMFSRFVESPDGSTTTYGLSTIDYVDKDDRYPYQPSSRLRRDISACCLISQTPPDELDVLGDPLPGVTLVRFATIRLHSPRFPIPKQVVTAAQSSLLQWSDVMTKTMQERLGLV